VSGLAFTHSQLCATDDTATPSAKSPTSAAAAPPSAAGYDEKKHDFNNQLRTRSTTPKPHGPRQAEDMQDLTCGLQKFFRTSAAGERAIQGTGLGLSISKAIGEAHAGRIELESEENIGATIRVLLPVAANVEHV
jgi:hypothetical protein